MKENKCSIDITNEELVDYPYLGIGEKPNHKRKKITESQLEKLTI